MGHIRSAKELWSDTQPDRPVLIMGNSPSVKLFTDEVYDQYYTIGCNSRLHAHYVPDLTLMIDRNIPDPKEKDCAILTHIDHWKHAHHGEVYEYLLGSKLAFHPDYSTAKIDYATTSAYMAIVAAYMMGWRTINFVGIDLGAVNGKDRIDDAPEAKGVSKTREAFFGTCYNHLSYLIGKMHRYYGVRFYSLSPHSQLLMNGHVERITVHGN